MRLAGVPVDPDLVELAVHRAAMRVAHDRGDSGGLFDAMHRAGAVRGRITVARAARAVTRARVDATGYLEPSVPVLSTAAPAAPARPR